MSPIHCENRQSIIHVGLRQDFECIKIQKTRERVLYIVYVMLSTVEHLVAAWDYLRGVCICVVSFYLCEDQFKLRPYEDIFEK